MILQAQSDKPHKHMIEPVSVDQKDRAISPFPLMVKQGHSDLSSPFVQVNYQPQQTPVLAQLATAGQALQTALSLPNTTNAYVIPSSVTSVTFILNNQDGGKQPFLLIATAL